MIHKWLIISLVLIAMATGCIEEFIPPSKGYENLLVVEGLLTDDYEETEVRISRSIPLDSFGFSPEKGAGVNITNESGELYQMVEIKEGVYVFRSHIDLHTGKAYRLNINTANGKNYESEWVILRKTPPIDSVIWRYEEKSVEGLKGIQIYVNTHDPENNTWYYRWHWEDTWIFNSGYNSTINWVDGQIIPREQQVYTCWKNTRSYSILTATSKTLDSDVIYNFPLVYVANNSDRLAIRFSLMVKQYALSEESFKYWRELENVTENLGTLFDPMPATLVGNIHNVNNENETVLGYFDASTVQKERIFVDDIDLPLMQFPNYYDECVDTIVSYGLIGEMVLRGYELVGAVRRERGIEYLMTDPVCVDCTYAGTNVKPDFW